MVSLTYSVTMCQVLLPIIEHVWVEDAMRQGTLAQRLRDIRNLVKRGTDPDGGGIMLRFSRAYIRSDWTNEGPNSGTWQREEALAWRPVLVAAIEELRAMRAELCWTTMNALRDRLIELDEWLDTPLVDRVAALA